MEQMCTTTRKVIFVHSNVLGVKFNCVILLKTIHKYWKYVRLKVACTSGPIFEIIMKRYPIFSVQKIDHQIDQKHK